MKSSNTLFLLAALGSLVGADSAVAAPDTSAWKCSACPFPKGTTGSIDVGLGLVSDDSASFGDYTGLQRKGAHAVLGGTLASRGDSGYFAELSASDLGLDTRSVAMRSGHEGLYGLQLVYAELPRRFFGDGATPFSGVGGDTLTLPAGFRSAGTSTMPLSSTLQTVQPEFKRSRLDLGGSWIAMQDWTFRAGVRRDVRDGTRAVYGSFYTGSAQLVAPVDQTTDQLEVSASYATRALQLSVA